MCPGLLRKIGHSAYDHSVKAMGGTAFHITHISDGGSMILYR